MLLMDGHGSHCTYEFLDYCISIDIIAFYLPSHMIHTLPIVIDYCIGTDIITFCLPPHTTHILQSLDVVVFQLYKHWHA